MYETRKAIGQTVFSPPLPRKISSLELKYNNFKNPYIQLLNKRLEIILKEKINIGAFVKKKMKQKDILKYK